MPIIETIEFTTTPDTTAAALESALRALDGELTTLGGFLSRDLYRVDGADNTWLLDYKWTTLDDAQSSMSRVASTATFGALMALVDSPETMRMVYGTPA